MKEASELVGVNIENGSETDPGARHENYAEKRDVVKDR
jgi:hypothetical protein